MNIKKKKKTSLTSLQILVQPDTMCYSLNKFKLVLKHDPLSWPLNEYIYYNNNGSFN